MLSTSAHRWHVQNAWLEGLDQPRFDQALSDGLAAPRVTPLLSRVTVASRSAFELVL
ncbi:MAG: hypothetical protein L0Z50_15810 [Verrucomicrobiales bacterium]|nr:hypothetical protein [Verrucomicrobiales bacterium]